MSLTEEQMYALLPAFYRIRDAEQGGALRELIGVLAEQARVVEDDIDQLYRNWFIETCEEWAVPYLGDLLGVGGIHTIQDAGFSQRARIANTLLYRQRKGTASMVEQLAQDSTGWPAAAVEFFQLLGTTQHVNHVRGKHYQAPNLRDLDALDSLGTSQDTVAHTAEVRRIASGRGQYNIPNLGIFLWRLQTYRISRSRPKPFPSAGDPRFWFDPTGGSAPLAGTLGRRALYADLEALRQARANSTSYVSRYFGANPVVQVWLDGALVDPAEIVICNLSDPPNLPPQQKIYSGLPFRISVGIDPALGRLALPQGYTAKSVEAGYSYNFSGDIGAGPYDRRNQSNDARTVDIQIVVSKSKSIPNAVGSLTEAFLAWKTYFTAHANASGMVTIMDNDSYRETLTGAQRIEVPAGCSLSILAGESESTGLRPHIAGDIEVFSAPGAAVSSLSFDGLLLEGKLTVSGGGLGLLTIGHSTLVPAASPATVDAANVQLKRSICGAFTASGFVFGAEDCILGPVSAASAEGTFESCTVFGTTRVRELQASNTLFTDSVTSVRRQTGCVRFSYVAPKSGTPRRYRCQPDLALKGVIDPARQAALQLQLAPSFTSTRFGDAAYGQLSQSCAPEIRNGADDSSEMGAFHYLQQPQREINLRSSLDEYLRFGLEAGLIFAS